MLTIKCNFLRTLMIVVFMLVTNSILISAKAINGTSEDLRSCLLIGGVDKRNIILKNADVDADMYSELNYQWNRWGGTVEPMSYLTAKTFADVRNAVICCKLLNIRIVPRCGGHAFDKRSYGDSGSLVVDLSAINQVSIDPSGMYFDVGAGALTAAITYALWNEGEYVTSLGICPTVGISGLAMGGGYGYFSRIYGLTSDNIVELQMIDANGNLHTANESKNEDLLWAHRGAGGGSLGIVTKMRFRMYKGPKSVTFGTYYYHMEDFSEFYVAYQSLLSSPSTQNNFGLMIKILGEHISMQVYVMNYENTESMSVDVNAILDSFSFPKAIQSSLEVMSYPDFYMNTIRPYSTVAVTELSQVKELNHHSMSTYVLCKSMFVQKILNKDEITELHSLLKSFLPYGMLFLEHNGGAIDELSRTDTAFVHRNNLYSIQLDALTTNYNQTIVSEMNSFYDATKRLLDHQESYQNYVDLTMEDYLQRYYGENLERLIEVKTKYDPHNVFHHQQSIPTATTSNSSMYLM